jgi:hypothetical protein
MALGAQFHPARRLDGPHSAAEGEGWRRIRIYQFMRPNEGVAGHVPEGWRGSINASW